MALIEMQRNPWRFKQKNTPKKSHTCQTEQLAWVPRTIILPLGKNKDNFHEIAFSYAFIS